MIYIAVLLGVAFVWIGILTWMVWVLTGACGQLQDFQLNHIKLVNEAASELLRKEKGGESCEHQMN